MAPCTAASIEICRGRYFLSRLLVSIKLHSCLLPFHKLTSNSTCIISILRVTLTTTQKITDLSWDIIPVVSWTTAELLTAVIVASLSTMRPLISRYVVGFTLHSSNPETNTT